MNTQPCSSRQHGLCPLPLCHPLPFSLRSYDWIDEDTIVAAIVPEGLGPAPRKPITPMGPKIEVSLKRRCWVCVVGWCLAAGSRQPALF